MTEDAVEQQSSEDATKRHLTLEEMTDLIKVVRAFFISALVFLVVIALATIIVRQLTSSSIVIEPIKVPNSLVERGYTEEVVAQWIVDEMLTIQRVAKTTRSRRDLIPDSDLIDVEMPGSGLSIRTIGHIARQSLGISQIKISGEIVEENKHYLLRMRFNDGMLVEEGELDNRMRELVRGGAQGAIKMIDPFMLASYFHTKGDGQAMVQMIEHCLSDTNSENDAWAYNLHGIWHASRKNWDAAIEQYKNAVSADKKFALAYHNWGNALSKQGDYSKATERYSQALALDSKLDSARSNWSLTLMNWGDGLNRQREHEKALEKYEHSAKLAPENPLLRMKLADVLNRLGDHEKALREVELFARLAPDDPRAYAKWGTTLSKIGDKSAAIDKFRKALALDPEGYAYLNDKIKELEADSG